MKKAKNKRLGLKAKALVCLGVLFLIFVAAFLHLTLIVGPLVVEVSHAQVDSVATTAISDAIYKVMLEQNYKYDDFIEIKYNNSGDVSSIAAKSIELNKFARELSTEAQIELDSITELGINVPLGTFTGINALSGVGPKVKVRIMPIGSVITSFSSSFTSSGINQTKHALYIDVNITISVILPLTTKHIDFITQVLICENIIVGKVPEIYLNGNLFG